MTERRWRVRVLFTFRGRPKTPTTDAAPGTLSPFHPATAILPTRLGHDASTARRRRGPTAPQALEFLRRERNVPGIQPYLVQNLGIHWTPSGPATDPGPVSYTHLRAHETVLD